MPKSIEVRPDVMRASGVLKFQDIPLNVYNKTIEQEKKNFSNDDFMRIYRDISLLREFESMLMSVKTQGKYHDIEQSYPGPAHLSVGQEAAAVGQAYLLDENDYAFGNHRSHSEVLAKSLSCIHKLSDDKLMKIMEEYFDGELLRVVEKGHKGDVKDLAINFLLYGALAEIFARANGFHNGLGGSMHVFFLPFGVYPNNAIVGGSAPITVGAALYKKVNNKDGLVICNIGDGSLGCGPVLEALNFACMDQYKQLWENPGGLPLIFNVWNNSYGMGSQTKGETMAYDVLARLGAGITPNQMHAERVDGYNPLAVIDAYKRKKKIVLAGEGAALLDVTTYRYSGHSVSDSNAYRTKEEMDAWMAVDPCITFRESLVKAKVAKDGAFDEIWEKTSARIDRICRLASDKEISPYLDLKTDSRFVENLMFSNEKRPKMSDDKPYVLAEKQDGARVQQLAKKERAMTKDGKPVPKLKMINYRDAISEAIIDKYYEDPTFICYGEDVREWGGAFAITRDLKEVIPHSRLFNSPISEATIVGSAVGYGLCGGRVMAELMYADFMGRAGDEIFNQMAKWQAMSSGILKMPVVLRVSVGSKYGAQHSQDWVALAAHISGLKVCFPATPYEAKGLLTSALNGTDPVVFFESQRLYDIGEQFNEGGVPAESYEIEFGDVTMAKTGSDITILTIGAALYRALDGAKELEKYGMNAEVINLHSMVPLNYDKIIESVKKTGKVLLVSDACARGSFLNDVAANISRFAFDYLDAPPIVVGAENWITPPFEFDEEFFPQGSWLLDAINESILPLPGYTPVKNFTEGELKRKAKLGV